MAQVVEGLFCVLATLGVVPIIRCPRGGAAEHVASQVGGAWCVGPVLGCAAAACLLHVWTGVSPPGVCSAMAKPVCISLVLPLGRLQLDAKLRDALTGRSSLFAEATGGAGLAASLHRPLLCLFDRNFEMSVVLQHAWTYKPLVGGWVGGRAGGRVGGGAGCFASWSPGA